MECCEDGRLMDRDSDLRKPMTRDGQAGLGGQWMRGRDKGQTNRRPTGMSQVHSLGRGIHFRASIHRARSTRVAAAERGGRRGRTSSMHSYIRDMPFKTHHIVQCQNNIPRRL